MEVEGVMVEVEEVMGEEVGVMVEEEAMEAMEGAGVATFKDHKDSLHQALASPPVQGYVCLCVQLCVNPLSVCMRHCALSLSQPQGGRQQSLTPVTSAQIQSAIEIGENQFKISDREINQVGHTIVYPRILLYNPA